MIIEILKFVHVVFGGIGIGAGTRVALGLLKGTLFTKWTIVFLNCSLVVSVTGLFFPFHHFLPTHWAAMSAVYVAGVAVLAWCRYGLDGIWALIFALSSMLVLCLDFFVVIAHVFKMLIPTQPKPFFLITELMAMLLFAGLGLFIARRYRNSSVRSVVRPQVNGCH
jgi:hypothetical protein